MKPAISTELFREVEAFLYAEARTLEQNRFDDWLNCFADEVRYWMPVRENVDLASGVRASDSFALYDDDKKSLQLRVLRIQTGEAHAEVPLSTTLRMISNIIVSEAGDGALQVGSNFMVYQERRGLHGVTFYGHRNDILRRVGGELKITQRKIELAQTILPTTISIFF